MCCFEKFEDNQHPSKQSAVIRVLKILEPVKVLRRPDSQERAMPDAPVEGELLPATSPGHKWVYTLEGANDRKLKGNTARGFQILFENEMMAQTESLE